ncbi:MAG: esterase-like activity of phytase family protein [Cyanobacteria bacterium P01_G01_bin.49]
MEFLGEYQLPKQTFQETPLGGLSAITYDRQHDRFYVLSDDRSQGAPARFYTLKIDISATDDKAAQIQEVTVEKVTFLKNQQGQTYSPQTIDPEGIALSPRDTVFISSEGVPNKGVDPFIGEFDLNTGQLKQLVPLPQRYLLPRQPDENPRGVAENLGFEPLTISATSTLKEDPFRLFTATEAALQQDISGEPPLQIPVRLMHYVVNSIGKPLLVAEHLYLLDETPKGAVINGLTELFTLPREGFWLSLERTFGLFGNGAKLFLVVNSDASETSRIESFQAGLAGIKPLKKKLLLDLQTLKIELDNLEGMTMGPRLADGSQTLVLLSDDNFSPEQVTQFLLFKF